MTILMLLAQGTAPAPDGAAGGCAGAGGASSLIMLLLMFLVFWLVLIRPQQKKAREHTNMLNNLKKGDTVVTRGGVIGKISGVADNVLTIEVQERVRVRVAKGYVDGLFAETGARPAADKPAPTPEAKS